jgi:S1-C subfamily serine protease
MKKLIKWAIAAYITILSLVTILHVPMPEYELPDMAINSAYVEGTYLEVSNREAKQYLYPVVRLSTLVVLPGEVQIAGTATGFAVGGSKKENIGYILTNDHYCSGLLDINSIPGVSGVIAYNQGDEYVSSAINPTGTAKIVYTDPSKDLCLLQTTEYIKTVIFEDDPVDPLEKVKVVGGPGGIFPVALDTYISGIMPRNQLSFEAMVDGGAPYLFLSGIIVPGHSGSPVFNEKGRVVGIVFATTSEAYGGMAVSNQDIFDFLDELDVKYKTK